MKQVIAFIAPETFVGLLDDRAESIGFTTYTEEGDERFLNGGNHLFYVYGPGEHESACFDQNKAEKAVYLLVPDSLKNFDDYQPKNEFAVLYHTKTAASRVLGIWRERPFYCGDKKLIEHSTNAYGEIARQLRGGVPNPDAIWDTLIAEYTSLSQK